MSPSQSPTSIFFGTFLFLGSFGRGIPMHSASCLTLSQNRSNLSSSRNDNKARMVIVATSCPLAADICVVCRLLLRLSLCLNKSSPKTTPKKSHRSSCRLKHPRYDLSCHVLSLCPKTPLKGAKALGSCPGYSSGPVPELSTWLDTKFRCLEIFQIGPP